jgi:hypothetical protein
LNFVVIKVKTVFVLINPLNAELKPICHLLALLGAHPILHVNRIRVNVTMVHGSTVLVGQDLLIVEV